MSDTITIGGFIFSVLKSHDVGKNQVEEINSLIEQLTARPEAKVTFESLRKSLDCVGIMVITVRSFNCKIIAMGSLCAFVRINSREAEIQDVVVDKKYRGRGIAKNLLRLLIEQAQDRYQANFVSLTSRPDRLEANKLYQSFGFKIRETNCYRLALEKVEDSVLTT